jgi:S1-C subfamily serine protease
MPKFNRTHLISGLLGGVVVAGGMLALGLADSTHTQTIVEEAPVVAQRTPGSSGTLTLHSIFVHESPAVLHVSARSDGADPPSSPFQAADPNHSGQGGGSGFLGGGSGFLVDRRGDVLTAYHLVSGAQHPGSISVGFPGGVDRPAEVIDADPSTDLAILRVSLRGVSSLSPLPLGSSSTVQIGDPTLIIGNPSGLDRTLSSGIVSGLTHQLAGSGGVSVDNVIQTDQVPDPGASGGPLLNATGQVIGVASQITSPSGAAVPFATPIDTAAAMLREARVFKGAPAVQPPRSSRHRRTTATGTQHQR